MSKEIKIKKLHSKKCCINGTVNEYYIPNKISFGNYAGNLEVRGYYYWVEMVCNDPVCNFIALINVNALSKMVKLSQLSTKVNK